MITVCILNWSRAGILREVILPAMARYRLVDEIIVSHGRSDTQFDFRTPHARVVMRDDAAINADYGMARRWLCWQQARNDAVLSLDDDILLPESSLNALYALFQENPRAVHGLVDDNSGFDSFMPQRAGKTMLVSGAYMLPRSLGQVCLDAMGKMAEYTREPFYSYPLWDGDDIFASLAALRDHAGANYAHRLAFRNMGIMYIGNNIRHGKARHRRRRAIHQAAIDVLGVSAPPPEPPPRSLHDAEVAIKQRIGAALIGMREAPTFFILGASRSGTTALAEYLRHHERYVAPTRKELYGILTYTTGALGQRYAYRRLYPWRLPWRRAVTSDATPHLLHSFVAPHVIKNEFPTARMIVLLRNPVDKVFSMYRLRKQLALKEDAARNYPSLREFIDQEQSLIRAGVPTSFVGQWASVLRYYFPDQTQGMLTPAGYINPCLYARWLERYFELFPREQFLIIQSERLFERPRETLDRVHEFLGMDITSQHNPSMFRRAHASTSDEAANPELRKSLAQLFKEPNARLFKLLGETYDWD